MKKILVINDGGSGNLGDRAIKDTLESLLRGANCDVNWVSFTGWAGGKHSQAAQLEARPARWKKFVRKMLPGELRWFLKNGRMFLRHLRACKYDLILVGGGQLIQSNHVFGPAMFIWTSLFKRFHKKKVILIAVGVTESYSRFDRYLFGKSLKLVDDVYVRDSDSLSALKDIFGVSARVVPDVAFCINRVYEQQSQKEKRAMFCPVTYEFYKRKNDKPDIELSYDEYLQYWIESILEYSNNDYEVKLFCMIGSDLGIAKQLKQILFDKHDVDIEILDIRAIENLTKEIAKSEVIVSARMHALIIGYAYGCKVVPYRTSEKIEAFEKEYIGGDICLDEVQGRIIGAVEKIAGDS
jgi:polysaccharide pyruvyl transferase WcaK-like protein